MEEKKRDASLEEIIALLEDVAFQYNEAFHGYSLALLEEAFSELSSKEFEDKVFESAIQALKPLSINAGVKLAILARDNRREVVDAITEVVERS